MIYVLFGCGGLIARRLVKWTALNGIAAIPLILNLRPNIVYLSPGKTLAPQWLAWLHWKAIRVCRFREQ